MNTEDLVVSLAQSATPVRVIAPARVRFAQWTALASAIAALVVVAVGPRADITVALDQPGYLLVAAAILATTILSAAAALTLCIPGRERSPAQRVMPVLSGALWAALLTVSLREGGDAWARIAALPIHLLCVLIIAVLAAISGTVLTTMLARGAALHAGWTAALGWIAAASIGALAAQLTCPIDDPAHHLTGHFAPFVLVAIAGTMLTWRSVQIATISSGMPRPGPPISAVRM